MHSIKNRGDANRHYMSFVHLHVHSEYSLLHSACAVSNGVPKATASGIYDEILASARYAFNKSHAVACAMISYQTAYLKCYYTNEHKAALQSYATASSKKTHLGFIPKIRWFFRRTSLYCQRLIGDGGENLPF